LFGVGGGTGNNLSSRQTMRRSGLLQPSTDKHHVSPAPSTTTLKVVGPVPTVHLFGNLFAKQVEPVAIVVKTS
jgi:hypothetical protein